MKLTDWAVSIGLNFRSVFLYSNGKDNVYACVFSSSKKENHIVYHYYKDISIDSVRNPVTGVYTNQIPPLMLDVLARMYRVWKQYYDDYSLPFRNMIGHANFVKFLECELDIEKK